MIVRHRLDDQTEVIWATPTSGYGHLADEQALPYLHRSGRELTPRFGGEESLPECGPQTLGLPFGTLAHAWPLRQRLFNLPRGRINLYWRNVFKSRCNPDKLFFFLSQLDFLPTSEGFVGECPLLSFERRFAFASASVQVTDRVVFKVPVSFSRFHPVVIPLFEEWTVDEKAGSCWLESEGFQLEPAGIQRSAAGTAKLWMESLNDVSFSTNQQLVRRYTYHFGERS